MTGKTLSVLLGLAVLSALPSTTRAQSSLPRQSNDHQTVVFMSEMSNRMPDKITYEYGASQPLFPSQVVLELKDIYDGTETVGRIPKLLRIVGCSGPPIRLTSNSFSGFTGYLRGFVVNTTNDGSKKCNTRNLSISFETASRSETGTRINNFFSVRISHEGNVVISGEQYENLYLDRQHR
jgi:hypothetical protein